MANPYIEGQDAAYAGTEKEDNPYKGDGEEDHRINWDEGWDDVRALQDDED